MKMVFILKKINIFIVFCLFCLISLAACDVPTTPDADSKATKVWNVIGTYTIEGECTSNCYGTWIHSMNITAMDPSTGKFSGNGYYIPDPGYTWTVEGTVDGSNINLHYLYTDTNAGYYADTQAVILDDGSFQGKTISGWDQYLDFKTTSGYAKKSWNLLGTYTLNMVCKSGCIGAYNHTMYITTMDLANGTFSGNGFLNMNPKEKWELNGTIEDSNVTFRMLYTDADAGYYRDSTGVVNDDGTISGTSVSSTNQKFTWATK